MTQENELLLQVFLRVLSLGVLYGFLEIFRKQIRHARGVVWLEDALYWAYAAYEMFCTLQRYGNGTIRWFCVAGAIAAVICYGKLIKKYPMRWISLLICRMLMPIKKLAVHKKGAAIQSEKAGSVPKEEKTKHV